MPVTCSTNKRRMSLRVVMAFAVTLATMGKIGGRWWYLPKRVPWHRLRVASSGNERCADRGVEGRFAPLVVASSMAMATAPAWPDTTTCPGSCHLRIVRFRRFLFWCWLLWWWLDVSQIKSEDGGHGSDANGDGFCISCPRSFNSLAVVEMSKASTAVRAEYSPKEWPATRRQILPGRYRLALSGF